MEMTISMRIGKRIVEMQFKEWSEGSGLWVIDEKPQRTAKRRVIGYKLNGDPARVYAPKPTFNTR